MKSFDNKGCWMGDVIQKKKSGRPVNIRMSVSKMVDNNGNHVGYVSVNQDISGKKDANQKLTEFLSWYEAVFEGSRDAVFISTKASKFYAVNEAACDLTGYTREELLKMSIPDLHDDIDLDAYRKYHEKIMDGMDVLSEARILKKNNRKIHVEFNNRRIEVNGIPYMHTTARDISARKRMIESLRESEQKYKEIFEEANDYIMYLSTSGKILDINRAALDIIGKSKKEVVGTYFSKTDMFSSEELPKIYAAFEKSREGSPAALDSYMLDKYGSRKYIESIISVIKKTDKADSLMMVSRDVTDRRQAERQKTQLQEQLFQSQKMESIGRLAGGIAHDFNNTLTGIMGYAELLKMKFNDPDSVESKAANVILQGTERAAHLTKQLLGFAQGGKYNPESININELIIETNRITEMTYSKDISIHFKFEKDVNTVVVDKNQIQQALTNIIINAKDFMPDGGDLTIETRNIFLDKDYADRYSDFQSGNFVVVSISDTGSGIPREMHDMVFEPFFTTKQIGEGTGLGLATVFGIIKNHNGFIDVYSEPGEGTTFIVYLPAAENSVIETKNKPKIIKGNGETILVVDDDENVRLLARSLLRRLGYNGLFASGGSEGIKLYKERKSDIKLVLLDVIMPNLDGSQTFKKIKSINPDVAALAMVGFGNEEKAVDFMNDGASGIIQKPLRIHDLSERIAEVLGN